METTQEEATHHVVALASADLDFVEAELSRIDEIVIMDRIDEASLFLINVDTNKAKALEQEITKIFGIKEFKPINSA